LLLSLSLNISATSKPSFKIFPSSIVQSNLEINFFASGVTLPMFRVARIAVSIIQLLSVVSAFAITSLPWESLRMSAAYLVRFSQLYVKDWGISISPIRRDRF
jgi:hypothetical protein